MTETTDRAHVALPAPLVFLGYLLGAIVLQWAVAFPFPWPVALRLHGAVLVIAGFLLAASAIREMRKMHAAPNAHRAVTTLVTTGPFRFTRNPIYLGFFLIYLGFTLLAGTLWGIVLSPFLIGTVTRWTIHVEEAYLLDKFGDDYTAYLLRVRRWI